MINILENKALLVYDFETDGFFTNNGYNRPIEVAVLKLYPDNKVERYNTLITRRDNKPLPDKITEITGITTEMLSNDGEDIKRVFNYLNYLFNDNSLITGHNILRFDNKFLNQRFDKYKYPLLEDNRCFDTAGAFKAEKMGWIKASDDIYSNYHKRALNVRVKGLKYNMGEALEYYKRSINIFKEIGFQTGIGAILGDIGFVYYLKGKLKEL